MHMTLLYFVPSKAYFHAKSLAPLGRMPMNPDGHATGPLQDVAAPDAEEAIFAGKSENKRKNVLALEF